uniref:Nuclear hormone receptor HR96 n=1 Tax=Rhabditophanes sp. KR3021 TaxID=114890 RepID=A0AC35UC54_9BILA
MNTPDDPVIHSPTVCQQGFMSGSNQSSNGSSFSSVFQPHQGLSSPTDSNSSSVQQTGSEIESRRRQKTCRVCGDHATGYNFNVISCESCKAFFRRNALRPKEFKCPYSDDCEINSVSRRFCQKCRLKRCMNVGMKKEWILNEEQLRRRKNSRLNHMTRHNGMGSMHEGSMPNTQNMSNQLQNGSFIGSPNSMEQFLLSSSNPNNVFTPSSIGMMNNNNLSSIAMMQQNMMGNQMLNNINSGRRSTLDMMMSPGNTIGSPGSVQSVQSSHSFGQSPPLIKQEIMMGMGDGNFSGQVFNNNGSPFPQAAVAGTRRQVAVPPLPQTISPQSPIEMHKDAQKVTMTVEYYNELCNKAKQTDVVIFKGGSPTDVENCSVKAGSMDGFEQGEPSIEPTKTYEDTFIKKEGGVGVGDFSLTDKELTELDNIRDSFQCMNEPLDNDSQAQATLTKKDHNAGDILNVMDITMRRLVKMAKKLLTFQQISETAKFALLKGGMIEMITIRGVTLFNPDENAWQTPIEGRTQISLDMFDKLKPEIKDQQKNGFLQFFHLLHEDVRKNELAIDMIVLIVLFDQSRDGLVSAEDKRMVQMLHESYVNLYKRYLGNVYKDKAPERYEKLPQALKALRTVAENAVTIFMGAKDTEKAASLPKEFFTTQDH